MKFSENISVYIKTTDTCQLNCSHCYTEGSKKDKYFFKPDKIIEFFKKFRDQYPEVKHIVFSFHGGEPMLAPVYQMYNLKLELEKLFSSCEFRIQTNLVYELTEQKIEFLNSLDSIGTSWDIDLRFKTESTLSMWLHNTTKLIDKGNPLTVVTCLSKATIAYPPKYILNWIASLGFKYVLFERISPTGNAEINKNIIPNNSDIDDWLLRMYECSVEEKLYDKIHNLFLSSVMSSYVNKQHQGCRTRSCERNVITINADGTIGGCPDSAPIKFYGNIDQDPKEVFTSNERVLSIACEMCRDPRCYTCPVFDNCNGDCYQLKWDEQCPAPKKLMLKMKEENDIETYKKFIV